jgi:hypothetical protein
VKRTFFTSMNSTAAVPPFLPRLPILPNTKASRRCYLGSR